MRIGNLLVEEVTDPHLESVGIWTGRSDALESVGMSYELEPTTSKTLTSLKGLDDYVAHVEAEIRPDHFGEESLFFQVVLHEGPVTQTPSVEKGVQLEAAAQLLTKRAVQAGLPMRVYVAFVGESEAA